MTEFGVVWQAGIGGPLVVDFVADVLGIAAVMGETAVAGTKIEYGANAGTNVMDVTPSGADEGVGGVDLAAAQVEGDKGPSTPVARQGNGSAARGRKVGLGWRSHGRQCGRGAVRGPAHFTTVVESTEVKRGRGGDAGLWQGAAGRRRGMTVGTTREESGWS